MVSLALTKISISSLRRLRRLRLDIRLYELVSWRISSPASMYHFLSIMVKPRFLSAGLMTMSWLCLRLYRIACMSLLSAFERRCTGGLGLELNVSVSAFLTLHRYSFVSG